MTDGRGGATAADVGEFGVVGAVVARLGAIGGSTLVGPGDDAALVSTSDGRVVATTDLLLEGRHFRRDWSSAADIGHKSAAQNLADVAAMGAVPTALLLGLGIPADLPVAWAEELADGLREECALVGAQVVGGDVVRSEQVVVSITALGDLGGRAPVLRSGARPGDVVAVAGRLGWAAAGLAVLGRGFRSPARLVAAHRRPQPPYDAGPEAATLGATAMVDVSDGLVADVGHVAGASGVAIELDSGTLEVASPLVDLGHAFGVDPLDWVFTGGDEHSLVATFPADVALPERWRAIGRVAAGEGVLVDGERRAGGGHDHFAGDSQR